MSASDRSVEYKAGMIIEITTKPEWGPGKIVHVSGGNLHIIFRDLEEKMARLFSAAAPALRLAAKQSDSILDNLPPLIEKDGRWVLPAHRISFQSAMRTFLHEFPAGFSDPEYGRSERNWKLDAHIEFQKALGPEPGKTLLLSGDLQDLAKRALHVLDDVPAPLLAIFELAAFHDALRDDNAARLYFTALFALLEHPSVTADVFVPYFDAVLALPAPRGRVASWPVATALLYLGEPTRYMFLKPEVTKKAAETLGFDLRYDATPNWNTYEALLRMGSVYLDLLKPCGARDFIDVQSFIYAVCGGYEHARAVRAARTGSGR